jgi:hypothetical protein
MVCLAARETRETEFVAHGGANRAAFDVRRPDDLSDRMRRGDVIVYPSESWADFGARSPHTESRTSSAPDPAPRVRLALFPPG